MPSESIVIAGRPLGEGHPCFVIAEAGVNHGGRLDQALALVDAAAEAGADAVKFQTFRADRLVTAEAPKARYQARNTGDEGGQLPMLRALELDEATHRALQARCRERGILFLSTPFEETSADLLERLDLPAFKVPSGEITNLPFLAHLARKGRPILLSTGMATLGEVERALAALREAGDPPVALLHCVSAYPTSPADANLRAMGTLRAAFQVPVGYSDHTQGLEVPLAAVALGACVLEKHFTLDRRLPGPDQPASLEPDELAAMVRGVRTVEAALGHGRKEPAPCERDTAVVARKSLVAAADLQAGTPFTADQAMLLRPGTGLPPSLLPLLEGRILGRDVPKGHLLQLEDFR
ncbi:N-acetylneuraminate synthase [Mesoterricola sediminis]|uniref:N-acetylneuraminate synthase n=1 Tax=Mesoterricola sediminis TaxID=2927980 RepID=A0AA48KE90_9BACT|nr:N-acetylneuraminate synthase [Mesoterricola sediminis]BDU75233.1 N-acetylneuraminate synthase [Mesoterricola sediminis]